MGGGKSKPQQVPVADAAVVRAYHSKGPGPAAAAEPAATPSSTAAPAAQAGPQGRGAHAAARGDEGQRGAIVARESSVAEREASFSSAVDDPTTPGGTKIVNLAGPQGCGAHAAARGDEGQRGAIVARESSVAEREASFSSAVDDPTTPGGTKIVNLPANMRSHFSAKLKSDANRSLGKQDAADQLFRDNEIALHMVKGERHRKVKTEQHEQIKVLMKDLTEFQARISKNGHNIEGTATTQLER